jgi:hypothetical protein
MCAGTPIAAVLSSFLSPPDTNSRPTRVSVPLIGFLIPSLLVFVLSGPIASRCHTRRQLYSAGMLALLGMFIANVANVVYDSYVGGEDHNLLPFEIPALILAGSPGLLFRFLPGWPER